MTSDSRSRLDLRGHGLPVAIVYVVLHVLLAWVSYVRPQFGLGITPWSPQAGVALAFLLLCGPRCFPVVALASFLSELWVRGAPAGILLGLASSLWVGSAVVANGATYGAHAMTRLRKRKITTWIAMSASALATLVGLAILAMILWTLIARGLGGLSLDVFTQMTPAPRNASGLLNALFGSLALAWTRC